MKKMSFSKNLDQAGFSHLLIALFGVLVIGIVGGAYMLVTSHADSTNTGYMSCAISANPTPTRGRSSTYTVRVSNGTNAATTFSFQFRAVNNGSGASNGVIGGNIAVKRGETVTRSYNAVTPQNIVVGGKSYKVTHISTYSTGGQGCYKTWGVL